MYRKKWITNAFDLATSSTVYFMFTVARLKLTDKQTPHETLRKITDDKKDKRQRFDFDKVVRGV